MEGGPYYSYSKPVAQHTVQGALFPLLSMVLHPTPNIPTFIPTSVPWSLGVPLHMINIICFTLIPLIMIFSVEGLKSSKADDDSLVVN